MTEEGIVILGIPNLINHGSRYRRSYSTGKFEILNGGPIFSRYLSPSSGSCHDSCKYGEERALEIKARGPTTMSKEATKTMREGQHLDRNVTSSERTMKSAVSHRLSRGSNTQKRGNPIVLVNRQVPSLTKNETVFSKLVSSPLKGTDVSVKRASDPKVKCKLSKQSSLPVRRCSNGGDDRKRKDMVIFKHDDIVKGPVPPLKKKETISSKLVSSPLKETNRLVKHAGDRKIKTSLSKNYSFPVQRRSNGEEKERIRKIKDMGNVSMNSPGIPSSKSKSEEMRSSVKGERKISIPLSSLPAKPRLKGVSGQNVRNSRKLNGVSHLNNQKNIRKPKAEKSSSNNVTENPLHVIEQNAEDRTQRPAKDDFHATDMSPSSCLSPDNKILKHVQNEVCTAQLSPLLARLNLRRTKTIKGTRSLQSWPPSHKKKGLKARLLGSRIAGSDTSSLASFSSPGIDSSEHGETDTENQTSLLEKEHNTLPTKGEQISLKDECSPGQKLMFRRGKVIDLQPEDTTLKRLNFRRRLLDDRKAIGNEEANTAQLFLFSLKKNLIRPKNKDYDTRSLPSPREKDLLGTQFGTCVARSYPSSFASLSASSEHGETDIQRQISDLDEELNNRYKTAGTISLKDECTLGQKLTFTRGNVVELQSEDSNLTRLKFRQRVLDDNQDDTGDDGSKNILEEKEADGGEDSVSETDSKKIVLKRQDSSKNRSSFNNVFEKTVTELVKNRKSKVKALVGAFETLISLHQSHGNR